MSYNSIHVIRSFIALVYNLLGKLLYFVIKVSWKFLIAQKQLNVIGFSNSRFWSHNVKAQNTNTNKISAAIYNCFVVHRNRFWIKKNKSTQLWGMVCTYSLEYVLSKGPLALIKCATLLWYYNPVTPSLGVMLNRLW